MRINALAAVIAVAVAGALVLTFSAPMFAQGRQFANLQVQVASSSDVLWLEKIATDAAFAVSVFASSAVRNLGQPKNLRPAAYARLGELSTAESLAAQQRVDETLRARSMLPSTSSLVRPWVHPGWHMGEAQPFQIAQTTLADGHQIVLMVLDLFGPPQLFLVRCPPGNRSSCSRAKPVGPWRFRYIQVETSLELAAGTFRLTTKPRERVQPGIMDGIAPRVDPAAPLPQEETLEFTLAAVDADADKDGWTDLEERTLGMDPSRADSDGDGEDDAHDRSPTYAPSNADAQSEAKEIVARAVFAAFGVMESPWVLFVDSAKPAPLQAWGAGAPVVFDRNLHMDLRSGGPGGVYVEWNIVKQSGTEATVALSDTEGPLAAGGQEVVLRKINGHWVVVSRKTTWIS